MIIAWGVFFNVNNAQTFYFPLWADWKVTVSSDIGDGCISFGISPISNTQFIIYTKTKNVDFRYIAIGISE